MLTHSGSFVLNIIWQSNENTTIANSAVKEKKEKKYTSSCNYRKNASLRYRHNPDTPDGKHEFHGTGHIVIQKQSSSNIRSLKKV